MVAAVILAGGRATRMGGGDKPLISLRGKPLLDHVIARIDPQVEAMAISANGDAARFAAYGLPVLPDATGDYPGPLAGIVAGMDWAAAKGFTHLLSVPGDTPFLPADLVIRLARHPFAMPESQGRKHPVVALWPVMLRDGVRKALAAGERRVGRVAADFGARTVRFDGPEDPFFNVNTPEDLDAAQSRLAT
jgi:molybdopterin-guanine dinucleotide biosynthesis protein A, proteobacterial